MNATGIAGPRRALLLPVLALPAVLGGCAALNHGFMAAAGPVAAQQRELFWIVAAVLVFVVGPVLILVPIIAWHYRLSNKADAYRPNWNFSWKLEGFIWIPPALIVIGLAVLLWGYTTRLDPYRPVPGAPPLEVQVIASDWKWVFIYPNSAVASVNRLVVPAGRPVRLTITSTTVMQSLMIPRLTGQIYAMAGMKTQLNFQASRTGNFRGANMQYNGKGFPLQAFSVAAVNPEQFQQWLAVSARTAPTFSTRARALLSERATVPAAQVYAHVPVGFFASVIAANGGMAHAGAPEPSR